METGWIVLISLVSVFAAIALILFIRYKMQGGRYRKKTSAQGKIVIITGSNTGIGKETALELAKRGAHVYLACRDMKKCMKARDEIVFQTHNSNIFCRELDLASLESVRKFAEGFKTEQSRLDILINNAGVFLCPHLLTMEGFEMQLGVNHIGHFLLTILLLDLLKKSSPSRIVNVASDYYAFGKINVTDLNSDKSYSRGAAYGQSKLANILFTHELTKKLQGSGVTANSLHPGVVGTDIHRHISGFFFKFFIKPLFWPFVKTPKAGAQTTLYAALDPDLELVSGLYFKDCKPKKLSSAARDDAMAKWLWSISEEWTQLKY